MNVCRDDVELTVKSLKGQLVQIELQCLALQGSIKFLEKELLDLKRFPKKRKDGD